MKLKGEKYTHLHRMGQKFDLPGEMLFAGVKGKQPGQKKFLHQFMQMVHVQKKLPCDVPL